mgnify:CR=1 FL=1
MSEQEKVLQNALQEMRRGTLVLAVLLQLDLPQYGYSLVEALAQKGLAIDQNTLYPLLRRLEKLELLESVWQLEDNRPRRYYQISATGATLRQQLQQEWQTLATTIQGMMTSNPSTPEQL